MSKNLNLRKPTPEELAKLFKAKTNCNPPPSSKIYHSNVETIIRAVAEFEPMGGAVIAYPGTVPPSKGHEQLPPSGKRAFGIPNELIIRMEQLDSENPVHIFIFCNDESQRKNIIEALQKEATEKNLKFDEKLIHLIPWDTDTYWTRDFAPWWVENTVTGEFAIAKHIYTSLGGGSVGLVEGAEEVNPREGSGIFRDNDDYGAVKFSDYLNAPIRKWNNASWSGGKKLDKIPPHDWFFTGLLDVGGNYMVNGEGIIASSYLVATQNELPIKIDEENENPNEKIINERMKYIMEQTNRFLGAHTYHVLTDPSGTYIGHIDCWGKFLAPNKILIAKSEDPKVNEAFNNIALSFKKEGFEVYRVLCQNVFIPNADEAATTAAYTNSLILNNYVYVPMAGGEYKQYDKDAIEVYKSALPGYEIVGIIGRPDAPWLGTDALHCRTNAVPRKIVQHWLKSQKLI